MSQGWICVHRQLLEWEWFNDHNTFRLFVYFMLKANHQDKKWKGISIKRGQHLSSLDAICAGVGLSKSQVRTSIKKLKSTHEIAHETNKQHTVITVINYNLYQVNDTQVSTQVTFESHTNSTQVTTNNNDNNVKKDNIPYQLIVDAYHLKLSILPKVAVLSDKRKKAIKTCWHKAPDFNCIETWEGYFEYISNTDFLTGNNNRSWVANFDFITNITNMIKIIEGSYAR